MGDYTLILQNGEYSLIRRDSLKDYAVVRGLDSDTGNYHSLCKSQPYKNEYHNLMAFYSIINYYNKMISRGDSISRDRLIELATLFKDGLMQDDPEEAMNYFDEVCEMTDYEKEFFGIYDED